MLAAIAAFLLGSFNNPESKIAISRSYWGSSAADLRITNWAMRTTLSEDGQSVESNLTLEIINPTSFPITIKGIFLAKGSFAHAWNTDGTALGDNDDLLIVLNPGSKKTLVMQHYATGAGIYVPAKIYEIPASFIYDGQVPSIHQNGSIPIVGKNFVNVVAGFGGAGSCASGTSVCPDSDNCCADGYCVGGSVCCPPPGEACGSACCSSSQNCVSGSCVADCESPNFACGTNCCGSGELCDRQSLECIEAAACIPDDYVCGNFCCNNPPYEKCFSGNCYTECPSGTGLCGPDGNGVNYCCDIENGEACDEASGTCTSCTSPSHICVDDCCSSTQKCDSGTCVDCESPTSVACNTTCCADNEACLSWANSDCGTCPSWRVCGESSEFCCNTTQKCDSSTNTCVDCPEGTIACGEFCCPEPTEDLITCDVDAEPAECSNCCPAGTFNCNNEYCCSPEHICSSEGQCVPTTCSAGEVACPLDASGSTYECCTAGEVCNMNSSFVGCIAEEACQWLPICGEGFCCDEGQYCYDGNCMDSLPSSATCNWSLVCPPSQLCYQINQTSGLNISPGVCCAAGETCSNETGECCTYEVCATYNETLGLWFGLCCNAGDACMNDSVSGQNVCCPDDSYTFVQRTGATTSESFSLSSQCTGGLADMCCSSDGSSSCIPPTTGETCCNNTQICMSGQIGPSFPTTSNMTWVCCDNTTFCGSDPISLPLNRADEYYNQTYGCCDLGQQCDVPSINGTPSYTCCPADTTCFNDVLCCSGDPTILAGGEGSGNFCTGIELGATTYCCTDEQKCAEIYSGGLYSTYSCCLPEKYNADTKACCSNTLACVGTPPDQINCKNVNLTDTDGDGLYDFCDNPACAIDCCTPTCVSNIGGVCHPPIQTGGGYMDWVCDSATDDTDNGCYLQCVGGEDPCPEICGDGSCCEADTCLDRTAPYSDNICCDLAGYVQTPTPDAGPPETVATECCPEDRAVPDGSGGYSSCCAYGSIAALDANTQTWSCCNGTAVDVRNEFDEIIGSICCADYTYSYCDTPAGYTCCAADHCNPDGGGACCEGSLCGEEGSGSQFCCPADATECYQYTNVPTNDYDCCTANKVCDINDGSGNQLCCESTETCRPIQGELTNKCCPDADICGSTACCADGLGCIDSICQACTQDADCPSTEPYCNTVRTPNTCLSEPCLSDSDCPIGAPTCNTDADPNQCE